MSPVIFKKLCPAWCHVLFLTNRFSLCSCPLNKTLFHFFQTSSALPSSLLSPSTPFSLYSLHLSFLCCFAVQRDRFSRLPLAVLPWPCDDCVLYQSVTCVLAQPLPVPWTHRGGAPCAAAALTGRRAAWPPRCRPTEPSTLQWWEHLFMLMYLAPLAYEESSIRKENNCQCCYLLNGKLSLPESPPSALLRKLVLLPFT